MPWKIADVEKHNKNLTTQQKKVWVAAANNALRMCEAKGGKDCDARAIRIANAAAKRIKESYASPELLTSLLPQSESSLRERLSDVNDVDALIEATDMLAQDDSYSSRMSTVSDAVQVWVRKQNIENKSDYYSYGWAYIVDMYPDVAIFRWNNMLWRATYTIDSENKASLGEPEQVRLYYASADTAVSDESFHEIHDPVRLFSNSIPEDYGDDGDDDDVKESEESLLIESEGFPISESAVRPDGTTDICLITPGWGSRGYYSKEVLERDGPLAFPQGTHMHWDHQTETEQKSRPERSLSTLAAVLKEDAHFDDNGPNGPGLYAQVEVFSDKRAILNEIAPHIGTSIFAAGLGKEGEIEGRKGRIVEALLHRPINTVDFVTKPGRGGKILELVEAARTKLEGPATRKIEKQEEKEEMDKEQIEAIVKEAVTAAVTNATAEAQTKITALETQVARQNDAIMLQRATEIAVRESARFQNLGERARARVVSAALHGEAPLKESGELDTDAIKTAVESEAKAELEYLVAETGVGDGRVRGMGATAPAQDLTLEEASKSLIEAGKSLGLSDEESKLFAGVA